LLWLCGSWDRARLLNKSTIWRSVLVQKVLQGLLMVNVMDWGCNLPQRLFQIKRQGRFKFNEISSGRQTKTQAVSMEEVSAKQI